MALPRLLRRREEAKRENDAGIDLMVMPAPFSYFNAVIRKKAISRKKLAAFASPTTITATPNHYQRQHHPSPSPHYATPNHH